MPDAETLKTYIELLHQEGGWALSVILMIALVYLHRSSSAIIEKRNDELKALLSECKAVIAENSAFMDGQEASMERMGNAIDGMVDRFQACHQACQQVIQANTEVLNRIRLLLEDLRR